MRLFIPDIPMPDLAAQEVAREHLRHQPALGTLGVLAVRLAAMTGSLPLTFPRKGVVVLAADHGHIPLGEETTAEGNAATHILARQAGATVTTVDIGLRRPWPPAPITTATTWPKARATWGTPPPSASPKCMMR